MKRKISGNSINRVLKEHLKKDSKLLKGFGQLLQFGLFFAVGKEFAVPYIISQILKSSGGVLDIIDAFTNDFKDPDSEFNKSIPHPYKKYEIVYYVLCQKYYLKSLSSWCVKNEQKQFRKQSIEQKRSASWWETNEKKRFRKQGKAQISTNTILEEINKKVLQLHKVDVEYLLCAQITKSDIPLYETYSSWFVYLLSLADVDVNDANSYAKQIKETAINELYGKLAEDNPNDNVFSSLRNFLALHFQNHVITELSKLNSTKKALEGWVDSPAQMADDQRECWREYRQILKKLPDDKRTMYNEVFGVRKVFVCPEVDYYIAGPGASHGKQEKVTDTGKLLGSLISKRTPNEDLIILCGGPGSGKSTLFRLISSKLAEDERLHPIFIKLRRLGKDQDLLGYLESTLSAQGIVNRITDLRKLSNLVLILDGFDEILLADKSRMNSLFRCLQDFLATSVIFRKSKILISGRDTLFPKGEGLPYGSHVIQLRPFDKPRVRQWMKNWILASGKDDLQHFEPEKFIAEDGSENKEKGPIHHLVTWPLTLHLVAQVQRSKLLDLNDPSRIDKAFLYKCILKDTIERQVDKGDHNLSGQDLYNILSELAWEMYITWREHLDSKSAYAAIDRLKIKAIENDKNAQSDIRQTAILNAPQLYKSASGGLVEFIHKSFAEYLIALRIANKIDYITQTVGDPVDGNLVFRIDDNVEAIRHVALEFGLRIIPTDVQDMIKPMLGNYTKYKLASVCESAGRPDPALEVIVQRFNCLMGRYIESTALTDVIEICSRTATGTNKLTFYANFGLSLWLMGAAARSIAQKDFDEVFFTPKRLIRYYEILKAGDVRLDRDLGEKCAIRIRSTHDQTDGPRQNLVRVVYAMKNLQLCLGLRCDEYRALLGFGTISDFQQTIARMLTFVISWEQLMNLPNVHREEFVLLKRLIVKIADAVKDGVVQIDSEDIKLSESDQQWIMVGNQLRIINHGSYVENVLTILDLKIQLQKAVSRMQSLIKSRSTVSRNNPLIVKRKKELLQLRARDTAQIAIAWCDRVSSVDWSA